MSKSINTTINNINADKKQIPTLLPFTITTYDDANNLADLVYNMKYNVSDEETIDIIHEMKEANFEEIEEGKYDEWDMSIVASYQSCSKLMREFACDVVYDYLEKQINVSLKLKIQKFEEDKKRKQLEDKKQQEHEDLKKQKLEK